MLFSYLSELATFNFHSFKRNMQTLFFHSFIQNLQNFKKNSNFYFFVVLSETYTLNFSFIQNLQNCILEGYKVSKVALKIYSFFFKYKSFPIFSKLKF